MLNDHNQVEALKMRELVVWATRCIALDMDAADISRTRTAWEPYFPTIVPYFPHLDPYFPIGQGALPSSMEPYVPPRGAKPIKRVKRHL